MRYQGSARETSTKDDGDYCSERLGTEQRPVIRKPVIRR